MRPISELVGRIRQWLGESRGNQFLAASVALVAAALGIVVAVSGDSDGRERVIVRTVTPSPAAEAPTRTSRRNATASPTPEVERPDPQTLLQPGHVLEQSLDVNLDGSEFGQLAIVSHTTREVLVCSGQALDPKTGQPLPSPVGGCDDATIAGVPPKGDCPAEPNGEFDASACIYRLEVFSYNPGGGWARTFTSDQHRLGIQGGMDVSAFELDEDRQALVLAADYCTGVGSGCGTYLEVLAVKDGEVSRVYDAWKAAATVVGNSVVFSEPFYSDGPLFSGLCCPNGILRITIGLDADSGAVAIIGRELPICVDGTMITAPAEPPHLLVVRCLSPDDPAYSPPLHVGGFETTAQTLIEPAAVGGLQGVAEGDHVRVEYSVKECPSSLLDCSPDSITPVATKITVLNP